MEIVKYMIILKLEYASFYFYGQPSFSFIRKYCETRLIFAVLKRFILSASCFYQFQEIKEDATELISLKDERPSFIMLQFCAVIWIMIRFLLPASSFRRGIEYILVPANKRVKQDEWFINISI